MNWTVALGNEADHRLRLEADLEYFAKHNLRIRPKSGGREPFLFNPAQRKLHEIIEKQRAETGRVRIIILKARQMGISTYIAARFYRRTISKPGLRTLIIAHEKPASNNLFKLVKRFNDNMPDNARPSVGISNAQELIFDNIDSGYGVSVATEDGAGRSDTAQQLHASEAALWKDLQTQMAALLQTVPDMDDTEVIFETTGNGYNDFYQFWRKAQAGENRFLAVFLPWSIDPSYRAALPDDFSMTAQEKNIAELHGLDTEQICWRRNKIAEMGAEELFLQEYPLTPDEAFIASDFDSFIPAEIVLRARKETIEAKGPLLIGVDPAGKGADSTAIAWRRGSCIEKIVKRHGLDTMQVAGWIQQIVRDDKPERVNIDVGGLGTGVYDRLVELGLGATVQAVNFGGKPLEPPPLDESGKPAGGPANRRAEMWGNMKKALEGRFSIPDSTSLHGDLTSVGYSYRSDGTLLLEAKEAMRKRGIPSPDEGDAMALCFSSPMGSPYSGAVPNFNRVIEYPRYSVV